MFGILYFSRLKQHHHASNNPVYHQYYYLVVHSFVFSKKVFHWEPLEFGLPYIWNYHSSIAFIIWSWQGVVQIEVREQLEKGLDPVNLGGGGGARVKKIKKIFG